MISDTMSVLGLQQEIQRSDESRYDHRLHGVLLVAQGMTCPEVARLLGDAPRSVEYWVHRFEQQGLGGLAEGERSGRPSRLSEKQSKEINRVLRERPSDAGMRVNLWDGKTLSAWIEKTYGIQLGVRQCQRLFRHSSSGSASLGQFWREPIRYDRKHIKKTPQVNAGRFCRPLGARRSALSATGIPLPHVGSTGNQRSDRIPSSDPEKRGLLRRSPFARWRVFVSSRDRAIQWRVLLGVPQDVPRGQHCFRPSRTRHQ